MLERNLAVGITAMVLVAIVVTALGISMMYNYAYDYVYDSAMSVHRSCGAVGPDGPDVDGLIGFSNPSTITVDASWKYEFYFSNTVKPDAFGALSVHVPPRGTIYSFVKFYNLAGFDQSSMIAPRLFKLTGSYHALTWSFDKTEETNGTMLIPFFNSEVVPDC